MIHSPFMLVPFPRNPFFVGQETMLRELHADFQRGQFVIIYGPGGTGKTALALEYVYSYAAQYPCLFWLNARTRETLLADYQELAQHLPLLLQAEVEQQDQGEQDRQEEQKPALTLPHWLATVREYVLVLDDLRDPALIKQIFSAPLVGHVLITTRERNLELAQPAALLELPRLNTQASVQLLLHLARQTPPTEDLDESATGAYGEAFALTRELRGQPLVLTLAGAGIKGTGFSFPHFLQEYHTFFNQLPAFQEHPDGFSRELEAVVTFIVTFLNTTNPLAAEILETCAFLAPSAIPALLFNSESSEPSTVEQYNAERDQALELLVVCGLLTYGASKQVIYIHPLIQQVVQRVLVLEQQRRIVTRSLHLLFQLIPACKNNAIWCLRILAHIQQSAVLSEPWTFTSPEIARTFTWAADLLAQQAASSAAIFLLKKALAIWEHVPGTKPTALIALRQKLVRLFEESGNYSETAHELQQIIKDSTRVHGGDHPETILHLSHLARVYVAQHNKVEAEACYQKALTLSQRGRDAADLLVLAIQYEMAMFYVRAGEFSDAEFLLQGIYTISQHKLGAEHPETLQRALEVAMACLMQHKWAEAEALYQHVCTSYARNTALRDAEAIRVWHYLALTLFAQAKWEAAEATYQRVLARSVETLGRLHPTLLRYLTEMFYLYQAQEKQGREQEKQAAKQTILAWIQEIREDQFAHPQDTAPLAMLENLDALGGIYLGQGKFIEAERLLMRSLLLSEQLNLNDPTALAINLSALALTQTAQGEARYQQASLFLQAALIAWKHVLGSDTPEIAALQASYQQWLQEHHIEN